MTRRLPIGEILNEAFQFGFQRWTTVFRFGWLALGITGLLGVGLQYVLFDMEAIHTAALAGIPVDVDAVSRVSPGMMALIIVAAVVAMIWLVSGVIASIYRLAALGEERPGMVQLRFDGPAQRVFWAQLIVALINAGILLLGIIIAVIASRQSPGEVMNALGVYAKLLLHASLNAAEGPPDASQLSALSAPLGAVFSGVFMALLPILILNVRLSPFPPGSACENRLLLFGSLALTKGSFWVLLGMYSLFGMAVLLLALVYSIAMSFLGVMGSLGGAAGLSVIGGVFSIVSIALFLCYQIFMLGVQSSLHAIVYRQLKTDG